MSMLIRASSELEALTKRAAYLNEVAYANPELPGRYADDLDLPVPEIESP